jgi:hypothetical protein
MFKEKSKEISKSFSFTPAHLSARSSRWCVGRAPFLTHLPVPHPSHRCLAPPVRRCFHQIPSLCRTSRAATTPPPGQSSPSACPCHARYLRPARPLSTQACIDCRVARACWPLHRCPSASSPDSGVWTRAIPTGVSSHESPTPRPTGAASAGPLTWPLVSPAAAANHARARTHCGRQRSSRPSSSCVPYLRNYLVSASATPPPFSLPVSRATILCFPPSTSPSTAHSSAPFSP